MKAAVKQKCVEYKNGGCLFCGPVHKCLASLDFHHIDPQDKLRNISEFSSWNDELIAELDKCVCVCSNCHKLIHAGLVDHEIFVILED